MNGFLNTQKILKQSEAGFGEHRLGMELHSLNLELPVAQSP